MNPQPLINADVGELEDDSSVIPLIDLANIACGGHVGDLTTMKKTVKLALQHRVKIGAHPSYPNRENFGRTRVEMSLKALKKTLLEQIGNLLDCLPSFDHLHHIKPHGALYHDMQDPSIFQTIIEVIKELFPSRSIRLVWTAQNLTNKSNILAVARKNRIEVLEESFADRAYLTNGLANRNISGSVYHNVSDIISQFHELGSGKVTPWKLENQELIKLNEQVKLTSQTICFHGDNPASVEALKIIR